MSRGRVIRGTRLLVSPVGVAFVAIALTTHLVLDRPDGKSKAQRDYEAIARDTERACTPDPEYGNRMCGAPNSAKSDLSVTATATRTGSDITINAIVGNHQWANAKASGFGLRVKRHPDPKPYLEPRHPKLVSGVSSRLSREPRTECSQGGCEFFVPVAPGSEVGVEITVYAPDTNEISLTVSTFDHPGHYLELHEEDNLIVVPVQAEPS